MMLPIPAALPDDGLDLPAEPLAGDDALARDVWRLAQRFDFPAVEIDMGEWVVQAACAGACS
jgi:hypothetical protein